MNQGRQTRRRCLTSAVSVGALVSLGGWSSTSQAAAAADSPAQAAATAAESCALAQLLRSAPQPLAAQVGAALLPQWAHATSEALVHALVSRLSGFIGSNLHLACDASQLQIALQASVRADFAQGRCATVGGWVLTRTELELCALAALAARSVGAA